MGCVGHGDYVVGKEFIESLDTCGIFFDHRDSRGQVALVKGNRGPFLLILNERKICVVELASVARGLFELDELNDSLFEQEEGLVILDTDTLSYQAEQFFLVRNFHHTL